jgi:hypothetical protein
MRYWDDFSSKCGFGDGESTPSDAEVATRLYLQVINSKAERLGSSYRLIPYNRAGMHNVLIIISATREFYNSLTDKERVFGTTRCPEGEEERGEDDELRNAIDWALEQNLDRFIQTKVTVNRKELRALLKSV